MEDDAPVCMVCADMEHLVFLPSGDAALTRRARAGSRLSAVVVRFSRSGRRFERQGILVEEQALDGAELDCLADGRRGPAGASATASGGRAGMSSCTRGWPRRSCACSLAAPGAGAIDRRPRLGPRLRAGWAARRPGARSSLPRSSLAVAAAVGHEDTRYDELLMSGLARELARAQVRDEVLRVLDGWRR